jgi:hypothetical protein
MRKMILIGAILPLAGLAACATTQTATAEERAYCAKMAEEMGTRTTHDHGEMKGGPANPMNASHQRCQQVLAADAR